MTANHGVRLPDTRGALAAAAVAPPWNARPREPSKRHGPRPSRGDLMR